MFSVFVAVYMLLIIILAMPVLLICFLIGLFNTKATRQIAFFCARIWARGSLFFGGVRVKVKGTENIENIPDNEPVLFVGNHRSAFDILVFYATTPRLAGFIAKKEVKKIFIIRPWMKFLGCLFIERGNSRAALKTILKGVELIKSGDSIFICPEGTRAKDGNVGRFKEGSLKMAEKSGCAIVPIAIQGTDERFEKHKGNIHPGKCYIEYGKPVYLNELDEEDKKQAGRHVRDIIVGMLENEARNS